MNTKILQAYRPLNPDEYSTVHAGRLIRYVPTHQHDQGGDIVSYVATLEHAPGTPLVIADLSAGARIMETCYDRSMNPPRLIPGYVVRYPLGSLLWVEASEFDSMYQLTEPHRAEIADDRPPDRLHSGKGWGASFDDWGVPARYRGPLRSYFDHQVLPSDRVLHAALINDAAMLVIVTPPEQIHDLFRLMIWLVNEPYPHLWGSEAHFHAHITTTEE